jgi:hypothetical protein
LYHHGVVNGIGAGAQKGAKTGEVEVSNAANASDSPHTADAANTTDATDTTYTPYTT